MSDEGLRRRIASLAQDSSLVLFTDHAKKRLIGRKVTRVQVLEVLRKGAVVEPAHRNIKGNWQCTLQRSVAGDNIKVAAALEQTKTGETVIVLTVIK